MGDQDSPNLDKEARRVHLIWGIVLALVIIGVLVWFFASNWRRDEYKPPAILGVVPGSSGIVHPSASSSQECCCFFHRCRPMGA